MSSEFFGQIDPQSIAESLNTVAIRTINESNDQGYAIEAGDDQSKYPTTVSYFPTHQDDREWISVTSSIIEIQLSDAQMFALKGRIRFRSGLKKWIEVAANGSIQSREDKLG